MLVSTPLRGDRAYQNVAPTRDRPMEYSIFKIEWVSKRANRSHPGMTVALIDYYELTVENFRVVLLEAEPHCWIGE